jgi:hypothetical protein
MRRKEMNMRRKEMNMRKKAQSKNISKVVFSVLKKRNLLSPTMV